MQTKGDDRQPTQHARWLPVVSTSKDGANSITFQLRLDSQC
jgi:hypothetical protein